MDLKNRIEEYLKQSEEDDRSIDLDTAGPFLTFGSIPFSIIISVSNMIKALLDDEVELKQKVVPEEFFKEIIYSEEFSQKGINQIKHQHLVNGYISEYDLVQLLKEVKNR